MRRYLVVIPPDRPGDEARFHDVEAHGLAVGDELLVDDLHLRVRAAVDVPADEGYDATLVCTPDESP
jgi:hypothetical protein